MAEPAGEVDLVRQLHAMALSDEDPKVVLPFLRAHPEAASGWIDGCLPLHHTVVGGQPAVTLKLLSVFPDGAAAPDDLGTLPLHAAVANGASLEVVEALLAACPHAASVADDSGWTALTLAVRNRAATDVCRALLEASPAAAAAPAAVDGANILPLHAVVGSDTAEAFVLELLRACPAAASFPDADGLLPFHLAVRAHRSSDLLGALLKAHTAAAKHLITNSWTTAHLCVFYDVPPDVTEQVLDLWPEAAQHVSSDSAGMPLHLALARMAPPDTVLKLLDLHPAAARKPVPCSGDAAAPSLPLHIAARWGAAPDVVKRLLAVYPRAVLMKGGPEKMVPHKLAELKGKREAAAAMADCRDRLLRERQCAVCHFPAATRCSRCRSVWYCGRACQRKAWPGHKDVCGHVATAAAGPRGNGGGAGTVEEAKVDHGVRAAEPVASGSRGSSTPTAKAAASLTLSVDAGHPSPTLSTASGAPCTDPVPASAPSVAT